MSELTPTPAERAELVNYAPWLERVTLWQTAKGLAEPTNSVCPSELRGKTGAIFQVLLMGQALGIEPMQALMQMHVIKGRVGVSAQLMRAMVLRAGHSYRFAEYSDERVVMTGRRRDGAEMTVEWDIARASGITATDEGGKALTDKSNWINYPRNMLAARATTELVRLLFPDVVAWASYTPDELGADTIEGGADED